MNLVQLSKLAIEAALAAGRIIQQNMNKEIPVEKKQGGQSYASQVVTTVDKACETAILAHLLPSCEEFDLALLSEEMEDDVNDGQEQYTEVFEVHVKNLPYTATEDDLRDFFASCGNIVKIKMKISNLTAQSSPKSWS